MIHLFYAQSGAGKSALGTAMLIPFLENSAKAHMDKNEYFEFLRIPPKKRLKMSYTRITELQNLTGETFDYPEHCVQSNESLWTKKHGKLIQNYDLPGDKIGLYDENYETYCPPPCSIIRWDETQREASGRDSSTMSPRVSALLQLHRKWGLDILCFTQRSTILDLNIRDNCRIYEVESMIHKKNGYGFIRSTTWKVKVFSKLKDLERYLSTGDKTYKITSFTFNGCIFDHFNSDEGEEYFIELAMKHGLNTRIKKLERETIEDVKDYIKNHPYTTSVEYKKMNKSEIKKKAKEKENNAA